MLTPIMLMSRQLEFGGTERQLTAVALGLDRSRFDVHVACFRSEGAFRSELRAAGVPVLELPVRSFRNLSAIAGARLLASYLRQNAIQLVHTFDVPATLFGVPVSRAARVPVVLSSQRAQRSLTGGAVRLLLRLTDRMVNGLVTNCECIRQELIEQDGVRPGLVQVCYNGIDLSRYHPLSRTRPGPLRDASLVIGALSVLREEKGLRHLLEAFRALGEEDPGLRLAVVGDGPQRGSLVAQAGSLGCASRCWFEGPTDQAEVWLRGIDIFVLPSLSEALSNALMEAMACGCCVVASRVGGNPELVRDGETGLLFRAGDAADLKVKLQLLIARPDLRSRLAAAGAESVQRFSAGSMLRRMEGIYSAALDRAGSRR